MPYSAPNIVFRMRWMIGIALLAIAASTVALTGSRAALPAADAPVAAAETLPSLNPALADLAARSPHKRVEVIVQLNPGTARGAAAPLVRELGGKVTRDLHIINAVAAELPAAGARELASRPEVRAVSPNAATKPQATGDGLATSYNASIQTPYLWNTYRGNGRGVGVAVVDTGIAGDLADFRTSSLDKSLARHRLRGRQPRRQDRDRHATATARTSPASSPGTRATATTATPTRAASWASPRPRT